MTIVKDESVNKREVIVTMKAYEVVDLIAAKALAEAGLKPKPGLTYKVDLSMKSKDSMSYERDTEALAEGARVRITIDHDHEQNARVED